MTESAPSGRDLGKFRGTLVLDRVEYAGPARAFSPENPAASRVGILREPLPDDYYRRERIPPSPGGHAHHDHSHAHDSHTTGTTGGHGMSGGGHGGGHGGGGGSALGTIVGGVVVGILALLALKYIFGGPTYVTAPAVASIPPTIYTAPAPPVAVARPMPSAPAVNPRRAEQQAACDEQAAKRRALGIPSQVTWDNPYTCRASGGFVESNRL